MSERQQDIECAVQGLREKYPEFHIEVQVRTKNKVEVNCPVCGVTLDIYPVKTVYCPCCDCAFDRETGRTMDDVIVNKVSEDAAAKYPRVEVMCPGCLMTLDLPYHEERWLCGCPACKCVFEVQQGRVVGVSVLPERPVR